MKKITSQEGACPLYSLCLVTLTSFFPLLQDHLTLQLHCDLFIVGMFFISAFAYLLSGECRDEKHTEYKTIDHKQSFASPRPCEVDLQKRKETCL